MLNVKIIADSISTYSKVRITTFELEYHRFIHCFDDKTEILCQEENKTPVFMKFNDAISVGAKVAQYSKEDDTVEFVEPLSWIEQDFQGELVGLTDHQRLNFMVTDKHRMFVGSRKSKHDKKEIILAEDLLGDYTQKRFYKSGQLKNRNSIGCDFAKLLAYFISDGSVPKYGNQSNFHFKKDRKINEVCRLLQNLNISYSCVKYASSGTTKISFDTKEWMNDCYDSNGYKVLPEQFFNMQHDEFLSFKQGLLESDGCVANEEYNNCSEKLIDQLQALFTVNGCSFNKKSYTVAGYRNLYKVKFLKADVPILRKDKHTVKKYKYDGKVYCCTVPTGLIFVRREGIVHISGNCELMTHRLFSRNAASSRAIPVPKMLDIVRNDPAVPLFFGKNRPGMQAVEEVDAPDMAEHVWRRMAQQTADGVEELHNLGVHKQIANRPLEPYQYIRTVLTATDFNNWYWLRDHPDAQPEIQAVAKLMLSEHNKSKPQRLNPGEWHVPYVNVRINKENNKQMFFDENNKRVSLREALMISASCCAQVSYRKTDGSLEKAETVYKRLVESKPCHASPTEHQAMVIGEDQSIPGITHFNTRDGSPGSGNFRWWLQYRQLIQDNVRYN